MSYTITIGEPYAAMVPQIEVYGKKLKVDRAEKIQLEDSIFPFVRARYFLGEVPIEIAIMENLFSREEWVSMVLDHIEKRQEFITWEDV